jgi:hypothetical protein
VKLIPIARRRERGDTPLQLREPIFRHLENLRRVASRRARSMRSNFIVARRVSHMRAGPL